MEVPEEVKIAFKDWYGKIDYIGEYKGESVFEIGGEDQDDGAPVLAFFSNGDVRIEVDFKNIVIINEINESLQSID